MSYEAGLAENAVRKTENTGCTAWSHQQPLRGGLWAVKAYTQVFHEAGDQPLSPEVNS